MKDGAGFRTNKESMKYTMITEWNEMYCVDPLKELLPISDKISENGRNIYESNLINQSILEIDFDRTLWNELGSLTFWRFGISK